MPEKQRVLLGFLQKSKRVSNRHSGQQRNGQPSASRTSPESTEQTLALPREFLWHYWPKVFLSCNGEGKKVTTNKWRQDHDRQNDAAVVQMEKALWMSQTKPMLFPYRPNRATKMLLPRDPMKPPTQNTDATMVHIMLSLGFRLNIFWRPFSVSSVHQMSSVAFFSGETDVDSVDCPWYLSHWISRIHWPITYDGNW